MNKLLKLGISILVCFTAGGIGTIFTSESIPNWYVTLNKPFFSPPNWLFAPVWTLLYILMGISFYLIWLKGFKSKKSREAAYFFGVQLALNTVWSPVFFGLKNTILALGIIIVMLFYIYKTIKAFAPINKTSAILLYPYIIWVTFATLLNASIVVLNR